MTVSRVRAIKVPPYSVHSEKVVLGSMIAEPGLIASISRIIPSGESFFRPEHGRIFDAVMQMHQRHKPATTKELLYALEAHGSVEPLGCESRCQCLRAGIHQQPAGLSLEFSGIGEPSGVRERL